MSSNRPHVIELTFKDKSALYMAFMPFVKRGGVMLQTREKYTLGEEVFIKLSIPGNDDPVAVSGTVCWRTPMHSRGDKPAGIGVQFTDGSDARGKIEMALGGMLSMDKPTHTI